MSGLAFSFYSGLHKYFLMVDENLKEWIQKKMEEGVPEERIKKSLEETDHDPSVVDEVKNPFTDSDVEVSENVFGDEDVGKNVQNESEDNSSPEPSGQDSRVEEFVDRIGSVNFPSADLPLKHIGIVLLSLLVVSGAYLAYSNFAPESDTSGNSVEQLNSLDARYSGCPDTGVRINSVSTSNGQTTANVLVTRNEAHVVLEIRKNGDLVSYTSKSIEGEDTMSVGAVGDTAILRPAGCNNFQSERSY